MYKLYITLFSLIALGFIACNAKSNESGSKNDDGSYEVSIKISAGDDYFEIIEKDTFSFTPYPYNFGEIKNGGPIELSCLVISNRLSKNSRINVIPIGLLNYMEFDEQKKLIIAVPRDKDDRVVKVTDLLDLVARYPSIKNMIQDWTVGKCGVGCAKFLSWDDKNAAGLWIQRNLS